MEKSSLKDQLRFLEYAKGSAAELATQTHVGIGASFISQDVGQAWLAESKVIIAMITNLEKSIAHKLNS